MTAGRGRLGRLIEQRRRQLGVSISAAARSAGIDRATWTGTERGNRQTEGYNYAGIERALGWVPGAIDEVLAGGDPESLPGTLAAALPAATGDTTEDPLIVSIWADPNLSEDQRMQLERIVRQSNADREMVEERLRRSGRQIG